MLMTRSELEDEMLLDNAVWLWFDTWRICIDKRGRNSIPRWQQHDNLTQAIGIIGNLMVPDYTMELILACYGHTSIIPFEQKMGRYLAVLRQEDLASPGVYQIQVRCTCGEMIRYTNIVELTVAPSLI